MKSLHIDMNKPTFKRKFWDQTLQNLSIAFMVFAFIDIALSCAMVSYAKFERRKQAEDILNTPDLTLPVKDIPNIT